MESFLVHRGLRFPYSAGRLLNACKKYVARLNSRPLNAVAARIERGQSRSKILTPPIVQNCEELS